MDGNVREWCNDPIVKSKAGNSKNTADDVPRAADRAMRGGCLRFPIMNARAAVRRVRSPSTDHYHLGFRVIRPADARTSNPAHSSLGN